MPHALARAAVRSVLLLTVWSLTVSPSSVPRALAQGADTRRSGEEPDTARYRQRNLQAQSRLPGRLNRAFRQAAKQFDVPRDLLMAIAYAQTRFDEAAAPHAGSDLHNDDNGYGIMHLAENGNADTLAAAAAILGVSKQVLRTSTGQNIRGAAAVLRAWADEQGLNNAGRKDLANWYQVTARFSCAESDVAARLFADQIFDFLNKGFQGRSRQGEALSVLAREVAPERGRYGDAVAPPAPDVDLPGADLFGQGGILSTDSLDYGPALWAPARDGHYGVASRPSSSPIRYVVVHTTEGSYAGTISWFQSPNNPYKTSAHYVIRSSDGQITQMVREKDIAHHVRGYGLVSGHSNNAVSIGIEHEAISSNPAWFTDAMYRASAALTRSICLKYGIPMDRAHILGHVEVPGNDHTDPGPHWNWAYYMQLVTQSTSWSAIVDNATGGRFTASANWGTSSYSAQRNGADYRYAAPEPVSDAAWFKVNLPATANYEVYVWYPANAGYNASTPFVIATTGGSVYRNVNQQVNGGTWVSLGTFNLAAGDHNVVGVSRWASGTGYVIADAVKIVRR